MSHHLRTLITIPLPKPQQEATHTAKFVHIHSRTAVAAIEHFSTSKVKVIYKNITTHYVRHTMSYSTVGWMDSLIDSQPKKKTLHLPVLPSSSIYCQDGKEKKTWPYTVILPNTYPLHVETAPECERGGIKAIHVWSDWGFDATPPQQTKTKQNKKQKNERKNCRKYTQPPTVPNFSNFARNCHPENREEKKKHETKNLWRKGSFSFVPLPPKSNATGTKNLLCVRWTGLTPRDGGIFSEQHERKWPTTKYEVKKE